MYLTPLFYGDFYRQFQSIQEILEQKNQAIREGTNTELLLEAENRQYAVTMYNVRGTFVGFAYDLSGIEQSVMEESSILTSARFVYASEKGDEENLSLFGRNEKMSLSARSGNNIALLADISKRAMFEQIPKFSYFLIFAAILSVIIAPLLSLSYYKQIVTPTRQLQKTFYEIRHGRDWYRADVKGNRATNEYVELACYFNEMIDKLQSTQKKLYKEELTRKEIQLNYYSQQIRPHFILNVLNRIYTHTQDEWPQAKQEIMCLTRYFRYVVNVRKQYVPLKGEMNFIRNFFQIEHMRYGTHFFSSVQMGENLDKAQVPPLVITTFIENSIKHALSNERMCGIVVTAKRQEEKILIRIQDTGPGFSEKVTEAIHHFIVTGEKDPELGVGIANTLLRLQMLYQGREQVDFYNDHGAVVDLRIPYEEYHDE